MERLMSNQKTNEDSDDVEMNFISIYREQPQISAMFKKIKRK